MARHSPFGFFIGIVLEIAAVAFVVSFLPRIDLRPAAALAPSQPTSAMAPQATSYYERPAAAKESTPPLDTLGPAESTTSNRSSLASASFQPGETFREPPPLLVADPARPGYVEQRLDRSSQQLVNSVGSYVAQTAGKVFGETPPSVTTIPAAAFTPLPPAQAAAPAQMSATPGFSPSSYAAPALSGVPSRGLSQTSGSFPTQSRSQSQPRPWIRY
jgi:hypothetical protein